MRRVWTGYLRSFSDLRALPRAAWTLCLAAGVNRAGTMVLPFLTLYFTKARGFSVEDAATLLSLYGIGGIVVGPVCGALCDRLGAMRVMRGALFCAALVLGVYPFLSSFPVLVLATLLFAIANESFRPASYVLIAEVAPPHMQRQSLALYRLAINLGMSIGPALGGVLANFSFSLLFYVNATMCLVAGTLLHWMFFRKNHPLALPREKSSEKGPSPLVAVADRRFLFLAGAMFPAVLVFFQHESTMPLYVVNHLHFPQTAYGLTFTLNTAIIIFFEVPLLAATAAWSHRVALPIGAAFCALGFGLLAFVKGYWLFYLSGVFWTVGEMLLFPISHAYLSSLGSERTRGAYAGAYILLFNIVFVTAPLVGVSLMEKLGARPAWLVLGALGMLSALLLTRLPKAHSAEPGSASPPTGEMDKTGFS